MTCVCGHEEPLHIGGAFGSACAAEGRLPGSTCNCAGYTETYRCDFCMAIPATWFYPCKTTFVTTAFGIGFIQSDEWAACADCAQLIDANDRQGIVERLFLDRRDTADLKTDEITRAKNTVLELQTAQFWSVRQGQRVPISETAPS